MDEIDRIKDQWKVQRPDLDTDPMALIGRLLRLSALLSQEMEKLHRQYGLTAAGFDVLATLLRSGPPHALSPNQLLETMMVTSGSMTNRVDQLIKKGLVSRRQQAADKRSFLVSLTPEGYDLINRVVTVHAENQARLTSVLSDTERDSLTKAAKIYLSRLQDTCLAD
ncbi:MAG: MarR family transcriptional regulator [Sneathiellales bacterium]|nr:MarR family transcriptional regulator [Sneathiellales bacterium]